MNRYLSCETTFANIIKHLLSVGPVSLAIIILLSGCRHFESIPTSTAYDSIRVGPGPEDFAFDMENGRPRLIVSCAERQKTAWPISEFWEVDLETDAARILPHKGLPKDVSLGIHGVDIGVSEYGKTLFVVNHERRSPHRQMILMFKVHQDSLVFVDSLMHPLLTSPNDLCFDGQHGLFISNDSRKKGHMIEQLLFKTSYVLHVVLNTRKWTRVVDNLRYANGVGVNNGQLYVSAVREKGIHVYQKGDTAWMPVDTLGAFSGADNITFHDQDIYTTAHPQITKFVGHSRDLNKPSPGELYRVNTANGAVERIYQDNGKLMSAPSTAFKFRDNVYVAQVFRPYLLKLPLKLDE